MLQPNVPYFYDNSSMNTHSQKQHNKKRKTLQGEKTSILLLINNVHITMYYTTISYLMV